MKKILLFLVLLLLPVMVYAEDVKTLIPVDTKVSVKTEKFDYNNFIYNSKIDEKGNSKITFDSIKNNTISKVPVSINILLFDSNKKNIGYLTYCSDKDYDSNYSGFKLNGNGSSSFTINVVSKYFVTGNSTSDVKYISVLDENSYCQVGGYDKYKGLTLDEIVNGTPNDERNEIEKFISDLEEKGLMPIIIISLVGIAVLVIIIMVIVSIVRKVKNDKLNRPREVNVEAPIEETVDLTYDEVNTDSLEEDNSISMGEVNNTIEESKEENKDEEKEEEDGSDLTKFFN